MMENNSNLFIQQEQLQTEVNNCSEKDSVLVGVQSRKIETDYVSDIRNHISPLTVVIDVGGEG